MNRYILLRILIVAGLFLNVGYTQADGTDTAWQQAKSSNSIESLRNFIRKNPASSHLGDAGKALYAQSLATHNLKDLKNFYEEFYDFPEVEKAKVAYLDLLKKQTGLESRFSFREGKIGTLYVPSVTNSYGSTTTHYINGHAINETTYHDSTSGGYNSDRYGFTAVYQVFNDSNQAYVVRVRASGSSTMSDMHTGTKSWSADEYNYSTTKKSKISQERSYLIKAKDSIKDQVITGETKPIDFKLEIINVEPVSDEWMAKLQEALAAEKRQESVPDGWFAAMKFKAKRYMTEYTKLSVEKKLTLLSRYLNDPKAEKWHGALQNRYSETAEKNIVINIATGARFDRDFASNVDVSFENHTGHFVQVNFEPNFGRKGYVQLDVGASKRVSLTAKGVSRDSLNVDVTKITSTESRESSNSVEQRATLLQRYQQGVKARAKAVKTARVKAAKIARKKAAKAAKETAAKIAREKKRHYAAVQKKVKSLMGAMPSLTHGLIAHYKFDGSVIDSSGNHHDGKLNGGVKYTDGIIGSAAYFNGQNAYVYVKHSADLNVTGNYTFALWINSTGEGVQDVVSKGRDCLNSYTFNGGGRGFVVAYGKNWCDGIGVGATFPANEWHHITGVVDNKRGLLKYFLDGVLVSKKPVASYVTNNTYPLIIGRHFTEPNGGGGWEYPFKGSIDDFRIYKRVLSGDEIRALSGQG